MGKSYLTVVEAEGMIFDPYIHHAMVTERVDGVQANTITEEIQKGYYKDGKLLRPAKGVCETFSVNSDMKGLL